MEVSKLFVCLIFSLAFVCGNAAATGKAKRCRTLKLNATCTASSDGCWWCEGDRRGCYSNGDLRCDELRKFYDPAVAPASVCASFECIKLRVDQTAAFEKVIWEETYSGFSALGFWAAVSIQGMLFLINVANITFLYRHRDVIADKAGTEDAVDVNRGVEILRKHNSTRHPSKKRGKFSKSEIGLYIDFMKTILLLIAFTSALALTNRDAVCSWDDKAGCIALATFDEVGEDCRSARTKCCNALYFGETSPFCECLVFPSVSSGFSDQCAKKNTTCWIFGSFVLVMTFSFFMLLVLAWVRPWLKFTLLPIYCMGINACFWFPTYLWPTCADMELKTQYSINATILLVALVAYFVMFALMWNLDYDETWGFNCCGARGKFCCSCRRSRKGHWTRDSEQEQQQLQPASNENDFDETKIELLAQARGPKGYGDTPVSPRRPVGSIIELQSAPPYKAPVAPHRK